MDTVCIPLLFLLLQVKDVARRIRSMPRPVLRPAAQPRKQMPPNISQDRYVLIYLIQMTMRLFLTGVSASVEAFALSTSHFTHSTA